MTTPKYCYIQLTPLPKVPSDETEKEREVRCAWFREEVDAFKQWAGLNEGEDGILNIASGGYLTKFLIQSSYNPDGCDTPWDKALDYFIQDIFSACTYGDVTSTVDGQSFNKRVRWKKKMKGSWAWKTNIGIIGNVKRVVETPQPQNHTTPMEWWVKLMIASVVFLPIITILFAILSQLK